MHLAEGVLPPPHALACAAAAAPFVWAGARQIKSVGTHRVAMTTALLFAVTLFPVPVPIAGMSSHMCAAPVLALLLGASALVVPTTLVLIMQALFFAHGGLSTLGANVLTLGVAGPCAAVGIARVLRALRAPVPAAVFVACFGADLVVYGVDGLLLAAALAEPGAFVSMTRSLLLAMAPAQLPLALLEGALSVALVKALTQREGARLPVWLRPSAPRLGPTAVAGLVLALVATHPLPARASSFAGLDEQVFEAAARQAGRTPQPLLDLEGGELGRALFGSAMLAAGFVLGRGWRRLERRS